jgi:putative FmdB family regulatory protein
MPTYDYVCSSCGHEFETFQSIKADSLEHCPACTKPKLKRKIGLGAGIIFKGGGFYETDYKRANNQNGNTTNSSDKPAPKTSELAAKSTAESIS